MKISEIEEEKNNSSEIIDIHSEKLGEYSKNHLQIEKYQQKFKKVTFQ